MSLGSLLVVADLILINVDCNVDCIALLFRYSLVISGGQL